MSELRDMMFFNPWITAMAILWLPWPVAFAAAWISEILVHTLLKGADRVLWATCVLLRGWPQSDVAKSDNVEHN